MNVPSAEKTCTRSLLRSATNRRPALSVARPSGVSNWPSPEPFVPHADRNGGTACAAGASSAKATRASASTRRGCAVIPL